VALPSSDSKHLSQLLQPPGRARVRPVTPGVIAPRPLREPYGGLYGRRLPCRGERSRVSFDAVPSPGVHRAVVWERRPMRQVRTRSCGRGPPGEVPKSAPWRHWVDGDESSSSSRSRLEQELGRERARHVGATAGRRLSGEKALTIASCVGRGRCSAPGSRAFHAFRVATLPDDVELLERAWMRARTFLDEDPALGAPAQALLEGRPGGGLWPGGARAVPGARPQRTVAVATRCSP
jgi:hypothetical protein